MAGLRRLAICISIVLFILIGIVLLGRAVPTAAGGLPSEAVHPSGVVGRFGPISPGNEAVNSSAVTGTLFSYYFPIAIRSEPILCGDISVDTVLTVVEGPYKVACDVSVLPSMTLTIEAGAKLEFMYPNDNLFIFGTLQVLGTQQDPINFQPVYGTTPGSWGAVAFMPGSSGVLDHAILVYGGAYSNHGMVLIESDAVQVVNSVIQGSMTNGINIYLASPTISASQILSNTDNVGGGINITRGSPFIQNNIIANNSAVIGAGLYNLSGSPHIWNNIFFNNHADRGGDAMATYRESVDEWCSPSILNNILVGNSGSHYDVIDGYDCTAVNDYNDFWNNDGLNYAGTNPGVHDFFADPMWVDPTVGDYHQAPGSACVDAGDPNRHLDSDFEGEPRPMGLAPDVGPDEFRTLRVTMDSSVSEAAPGAMVTYTVKVTNMTPVSLTNVLLTDTLPVEVAFTSYQADGLTCTHDGSTWGGRLICSPDNPTLTPLESRMLMVTVSLTDSLPVMSSITNTVMVTAHAGGENLAAGDQAPVQIAWCAAQLNDTPMGIDIQAAIDASTQATDVVKVSGYCRVHGLVVNKTLIMQGGWSRNFSVHDPAVYTTTLDAQSQGRVMFIHANEGGNELTPTIEDFAITGGQTNPGGGIQVDTVSPIIQNNTFFHNVTGGGNGAAILISSGSPVIQNNTFRHNSAGSGNGGGVFNDTGNPILIKNTFLENYSQNGGGIYNASGSPTIRNNTFVHNLALYGTGGGVNNSNGNATIINNIFQYNDASGGGGVYNESGNPIIENNTLINTCGDLAFTNNGNPVIVNNILFNDNPGCWDQIIGSGNPTMDYNDVWNNSGYIPHPHDISADPMFVNPATGDYHLAPGSPCIDAGDPDRHPAQDFEGDLRPMGFAPDIGIDEFRSLSVEKKVQPIDAPPGAPLTYTVTILNPMDFPLTNVLVTDTLPVETTFISYQSDDFTCTHDGSAWGGLLHCTLDSPSLLPGESQTMVVLVNLTTNLTINQVVVNPALTAANASTGTFYARDQALTLVTWCAARLNDTPMGSDLQAAVDASTQATDIVKVSGYCPVHDLDVNKTLTLQGGWRYDFGVWDPGVYTTTLDGQQAGRVILVDGEVNPTIENFTITGGKTSESGGGISITTGSPTLQNNIIDRNSADLYGGGLYNLSGNPTIHGNTFTNNIASSGAGLYTDTGNPSIQDNAFDANTIPTIDADSLFGGGLYNGSGSPLIQNNTFTNNVIHWGGQSCGGGLYNGSGNPIIQNNTFAGNSAEFYSFGGGLYNGSGNPTIQYNLFTGNHSDFVGGGLINLGGAPTIQNNTFIHNSADEGGGLGNSGNATIQNNIFIENRAGDGGGISTFDSPTIQNNVFTGNTAIYTGGAIYSDGNINNPNNPIIQNNTVYSNTAPSGGGIYIWRGGATIRSNILVNNTASQAGGGIYNVSGTLTIRYNDVWNNTGGNYYGIDPGAHDISSNPRLVDPAHGNFHIASNSPCINKADPVNFPPTDFEGDPRPHGPAPDIGADEY